MIFLNIFNMIFKVMFSTDTSSWYSAVNPIPIQLACNVCNRQITACYICNRQITTVVNFTMRLVCTIKTAWSCRLVLAEKFVWMTFFLFCFSILIKKITSLLMHIQAFDEAHTVANKFKESNKWNDRWSWYGNYKYWMRLGGLTCVYQWYMVEKRRMWFLVLDLIYML